VPDASVHRLAIFGVTGRMGRSLLEVLPETPLRLCGALASAGSPSLGAPLRVGSGAQEVLISSDLGQVLRDAEVAVDFSLPIAVGAHVTACASAGVPLLIGSTGWDAATRTLIESAATHIPVLIAPNTSTAMNLMRSLVGLAARTLGEAFDIEISEAHHRMKRDAPSGTALSLGEAVAAARGASLAELASFERPSDTGPRTPGSIGFAVTRGGDIVGEHTVMFAGAGERLEITHRATDRAAFARGALHAALWLVGRPPGLYHMSDVLGL
jgi:4-hydroxy-tetrahydrodipicolinate reductase